MDVYLFSVLLLISIILLILNFFKKQIIVGIFAGIFFILCGILLWNGLSYISSTSVIGVSGNYTITDNYSLWSSSVTGDFGDNEIVGTTFVLLGLFLLIINMVTIFTEKNEIDIGNDNGSDEGED